MLKEKAGMLAYSITMKKVVKLDIVKAVDITNHTMSNSIQEDSKKE